MFKDEKVEPNMQKGGEAGLHNLGLFSGKYKVVKVVQAMLHHKKRRILTYLNILFFPARFQYQFRFIPFGLYKKFYNR